MSLTWHKTFNNYDEPVYYADRPNGDELNVTVRPDGTHTIFVYSPSTSTEYLDGDIPDRTTNECIARAEEVNLPDEDTGI